MQSTRLQSLLYPSSTMSVHAHTLIVWLMQEAGYSRAPTSGRAPLASLPTGLDQCAAVHSSQRAAQPKRRGNGGGVGADGRENMEAVGAHKDRPPSL